MIDLVKWIQCFKSDRKNILSEAKKKDTNKINDWGIYSTLDVNSYEFNLATIQRSSCLENQYFSVPWNTWLLLYIEWTFRSSIFIEKLHSYSSQ